MDRGATAPGRTNATTGAARAAASRLSRLAGNGERRAHPTRPLARSESHCGAPARRAFGGPGNFHADNGPHNRRVGKHRQLADPWFPLVPFVDRFRRDTSHLTGRAWPAPDGLSAAVDGGMTDVAALDDVDDVLGDIGGAVADALEIFRNEDQLERRKNDAGIAHHVGEQFAENLVAVMVHLVITRQNFLCQLDIAPHYGVQSVAYHLLGDLAHARKVDVR